MDEEGDYRMAIHFPELSHWCHPGVLKEAFLKSKKHEGQIISISFEAIFGGKTLAEVNLDDGFKIQFKAGASLGYS